MEIIKAQKGTQDVLPEKSGKWQLLESVLSGEAKVFGFREIRTPVFEDTRLFQRSVGETTDVVQKEMYTFEDKGGRSITLRPEGTASVVRAMLEHGLYNGALPLKLYYFIAGYRYEKPQAGRLREFHQFGVEEFGPATPASDAELIALASGIFSRLGIRNLSLEINSIGCPECRANYQNDLRAYFSEHLDTLCETCKGRLERNPMRLLDCKSPEDAKLAAGAPRILDYLCGDCKTHFEGVKEHLDSIGVSYTVNPSIVRGLDYYTNTVFEFVSSDLGAQSTVCGGGRYNGLVQEMGGSPMPALGFAMGIERLLMVMEAQGIEFPAEDGCDVYIGNLGDAAGKEAFRLALNLRSYGIQAVCDTSGRSLKAQMKYADKLGAKFSLVLGEDELAQGKAEMKDMKTGEKRKLSLSDFVDEFLTFSTEQSDLGIL